MDEQMAKDVETVKRAAGRSASYVTEGDIVTHALPIDPSIEDAKVFVSGIHLSAEDPQPQRDHDTGRPNVPMASEPASEGSYARQSTTWGSEYDAVNPPHYQRGPVVEGDIGSNITKGIGKWRYAIKCIDVMRAIKDPRLATAFKYIWRVAFGGKCEPGMEQATQRERDERDINSAVWYLQDWLKHEV